MRRRLMLLWTPVVLGLALLLPTTTLAASGYTYAVKSNYCSGNDSYFKVKETAAGWTPANGLTIEMWAQWHPIGYGRWHTQAGSYDEQHYYFPANGNKHYLTAWRWWYGDSGYWYRQVFKLHVWQGGYELAHKTLYSVKC
ncbi:MAG: hypothetical protein ABI452_01940 [Candidatus Limnocylindrales bacterium]